jgi:tRNA A-37 threonylcarbamoyl transferase component Bud32/tetratricopeptide (TPR) repeat protein
MEHEEPLKAALADRYTIEKEIGSGGMATVYLAQDLKHNRQVAVKVLDPELAQSLGAERFLREIKTVANLTHPHILPLFDSGEVDGFLFYVMPYVKGESLRARLTKEKQLPVEDAVQITREIADALAYAHEDGVIHRDVKPANIMLEAGHALLADFGVAHAVAEAKDERLTRTGTSLGTPAYMSPEQATGEQDLDGRSDQYALGCVLYEMLAGQPPFTGATGEVVIRQQLTADPTPISVIRPGVLASVESAIDRMLGKAPADRFKTTRDLVSVLDLAGKPPGFAQTSRWMKAAIYAGLFLVSLATVSFFASRWSRGPAELREDLVVVFPFSNRTGNPDLDEAGALVADWLSDELNRSLEVQALDQMAVSQALGFLEDDIPPRTLATEFGAGKFISGEILSLADRLVVRARVFRTGVESRPLLAEAEGVETDLAAVIEDVKQRVLTALNVSQDEYVREWIATPPTLEAWRIYTRGIPYFFERDFETASPFFLEAYEADTTFLDALVSAAGAARQSGRWERLDSLLEVIEPRIDRLSPFWRVWIDSYRSALAGDLEGSYAIWRGEYERNPDRVWKPYMVGQYALALGRPVEAAQWIEETDPADPLVRPFLRNLFNQLSEAHYYAGEVSESLEQARKGLSRFPSDLRLHCREIRALASLGRMGEVDRTLRGVEAVSPGWGFTPGLAFLQVARDLAVLGYEAESHRAAERALQWFVSQDPEASREEQAEALLLADRPEEASVILGKLVDEGPERLFTRGLLGISLAVTGDIAGAEEEAEWFERLDRPYLLGAHKRWQGKILAHLGRKDEAVGLLRESHLEGRLWWWFPTDPLLAPLWEHAGFREFIRPKG